MEPHGGDVGEGGVGLSQVTWKQECKKRRIILVDEGSHNVLEHTVCWSQEMLTTHDDCHQFFDVSREITES